jgi:hypothetical protein
MKLIASSVIRGSRQGEGHGGLYIVDLDTGGATQTLDWNESAINWEGRGGDRGLRGIAILGDLVFVAASDELFVFNAKLERIASYRNPYLKHCHEIWQHRGLIFLTSTGYDSLLIFSPQAGMFIAGMRFAGDAPNYSAAAFDPNLPNGPAPAMQFHLNNIYVDDEGIYLAGLKMPGLIRILDNNIAPIARLPLGTHNARPFRGGILFNNTTEDQVCWVNAEETVLAFDVPRYEPAQLQGEGIDDTGLARQGFGRGLCMLSDHVVAGGSSPSTITLYDLETHKRLKSINLSMDVRNAIHGLAIWPF